MKYVLVDKKDNIVDTVDLHNVEINGAKTYFVGRKQIPYENFIQLWKVMTEDDYNKKLKKHTQTSSEQTFRSYPGYIRWWEDEDDYLDIDEK